MSSEKLILTIPKPIFDQLSKESEKYSYPSIQQLIIEILREKYLKELKKEEVTRGRPKKLREEKILTRKNIFGKEGKRISI